MSTRKTFDTTEYEFAHGRKPRGTGSWAFRPDTRAAAVAVAQGDFSVVVWAYGTLTAAKAQVPAGSWVVMS